MYAVHLLQFWIEQDIAGCAALQAIWKVCGQSLANWLASLEQLALAQQLYMG